jgi:hypothetical protein
MKLRGVEETIEMDIGFDILTTRNAWFIEEMPYDLIVFCKVSGMTAP